MKKLRLAVLGAVAIASGAFAGTETYYGKDEKNDVVVTRRTGSETEAIGQIGGGIEVRFTPHIGWVSDFSWNFVDGPNNNFGMARTGVNFAF